MKSLLDALDEGRLIELPDNHKTRALEYLAALIEAIPDIEVKAASQNPCWRASRSITPESGKAGPVRMPARIMTGHWSAP